MADFSVVGVLSEVKRIARRFGAGADWEPGMAPSLAEFWGGSVPLVNSTSDLQKPGVILQFGVPPDRMA